MSRQIVAQRFHSTGRPVRLHDPGIAIAGECAFAQKGFTRDTPTRRHIMADEMDPERENEIKGRTNEESMIDTVDD